MTSPTFTDRVNPSVARLGDGYQSLITFSNDPDIGIFEDPVQPPGVEVGDFVDTTTQLNVEWETMAIHPLKRLTDSNVTAGYAPSHLSALYGMVGDLQAITITFPNGWQMAFWGAIKSVTPSTLERRGFPTIAIVIGATNTDPDGNEEGPVFQDGGGS